MLMMPLTGVRISCDMLARNSDLARSAAWALSFSSSCCFAEALARIAKRRFQSMVTNSTSSMILMTTLTTIPTASKIVAVSLRWRSDIKDNSASESVPQQCAEATIECTYSEVPKSSVAKQTITQLRLPKSTATMYTRPCWARSCKVLFVGKVSHTTPPGEPYAYHGPTTKIERERESVTQEVSWICRRARYSRTSWKRY